MNPRMAGSAILEARIGHVMESRVRGDAVGLAPKVPSPGVAFQANGVDHRPFQQARIGGTVSVVASLAAFHTNRRVVIKEGPPFIDVALHAGFFVAGCLVHHARTRSHVPGRCEGPVGIVAIGTLHRAFVHAMFERHGELRSHRRVAAVAEVALLLGLEQILRRRRTMNRVAIRANNVAERVFAAANVGSGDGLRVAPQAGVYHLAGR